MKDGRWNFGERDAVLRAFASDDPAVVAEASALLTFKARECVAAGVDPAALLKIEVSLADAIEAAAGVVP